MSLRRIAGVAAAAVVLSGAGLLLSNPTSAVTPPTPITLDATGMDSSSCPLPLNGSMAVVPNTAVQFKQGGLGAATGERLTISPVPNSTDPASRTPWAAVPAAGTTPITFTRAATYTLTWQFTTELLGQVGVVATQTGKLVIDSTAAGCVAGVHLPLPSVSASAVPSPIISAINGGLGSVVSSANSALNPVNSALPTAPPLPGAPGLPSVPGLPGGNSPGVTPPPAAALPGTNYKPSGPTVADRTVPKGYGSGSGLGGSYVPVTGGSIVAGDQQPVSNGKPAGSASSAAPGVKNGGSPRTVELASNRPRSALGALPTLAVILAILALSGATAFYARTFLLQPAEARAKAPVKPSN
ncbi:hypothetical protein [Jatrophihabitans sp.]|jgi:hypothetical protein|uniref:hypothetical protein n=1 Tax=Jatrophihabitans sp. TaxID=1932789 RepID=UPI002EEB4F57